MNTIDGQMNRSELKAGEVQVAGLKAEKAKKHGSQSGMTESAAHKIRNILTGAKIELSSMLDYRGKNRTSVELLRDSVADMVEKFFKLNTENNIPEGKFITDIIPEINRIKTISDNLTDALNSVSNGLDKGIRVLDEIRRHSKSEK